MGKDASVFWVKNDDDYLTGSSSQWQENSEIIFNFLLKSLVKLKTLAHEVCSHANKF